MDTRKVEIGLGIGLAFGVVLILFLLIFAKNERASIVVLLLGFVAAVLVGGIVYLYFGSPQNISNSENYLINIHNPANSYLRSVSFTTPDGDKAVLAESQSVYGVGINLSQSLSISATSETGTSYSLSYVHTDAMNTDVYVTPGGAIPSNNYIKAIAVDNTENHNPVIIYGSDVNKNFYPLLSVQAQTASQTTFSSFVGQLLATNSSGAGAVSISNSAVTNIIISTAGNIYPPGSKTTSVLTLSVESMNCYGNNPGATYFLQVTGPSYVAQNPISVGVGTPYTGWTPSLSVTTSSTDLWSATSGEGLQILRQYSWESTPTAVVVFGQADLTGRQNLLWTDQGVPSGNGVTFCCSSPTCTPTPT
jgi:hypothetical protein